MLIEFMTKEENPIANDIQNMANSCSGTVIVGISPYPTTAKVANDQYIAQIYFVKGGSCWIPTLNIYMKRV